MDAHACLSRATKFYAVLDSPCDFLSEQQIALAQESITDFLSSYAWLTDWAINHNVLRWQVICFLVLLNF